VFQVHGVDDTGAVVMRTDLGAQLVEASEEKDQKKADVLMERIEELEKMLGPEYPHCSTHFMKLTQIPKTFRTSSQCSIGSTRPVHISRANDP
jgi:hypothetical protein